MGQDRLGAGGGATQSQYRAIIEIAMVLLQRMTQEGDAVGKQLTEQDLRYAAYKRCPCGAGLAYVPGSKEQSWDCSDILLGRAATKDQAGSVEHTGKLPFIFYEILGEQQPSAKGATTRPQAAGKG